ncbi:hypothetical protein [Bacillus sp. AFS088145]|uniref:hypothetical protein n=1 Tax=Bacillus sp. AFS088145 TaxID=2033514 RepID=UPI000BF9739D|nr:hypothetical protein [Bacillus sp. AFS088145]PFH90720.1 hypothetical protein COI44_04335 [Bacillus sp. AFS088145]
MGILSLIAGGICLIISLGIFLHDIKKATSTKDRLGVFFNFVLEPFVGLTSLFYLGLLLVLFGLLKNANLL